MKSKPLVHKSTNTFVFKSFSARISEIHVDATKNFSRAEAENVEDVDSVFKQSLDEWADLNRSGHFTGFVTEVEDWCGTYAQIVHNKENIVRCLLSHISTGSTLSLEPLLHLVHRLAVDLDEDLYSEFPSILECLRGLLQSFAGDSDVLEWAFSCLAHLLKVLWRYAVKDIHSIYSLVEPLVYSSKEHIQRFVAGSLGFLVRKVKDKKKLFSSILKKDLNADAVRGVSHVIFETIRGVSGQFHSCVDVVMPIVFEIVASHDTRGENSEEEKLRSCLENTLELMASQAETAERGDKLRVKVIWDLFKSIIDAALKAPSPGDESSDVERLERVASASGALSVWIEYRGGKMVTEPTNASQLLLAILSSDLYQPPPSLSSSNNLPSARGERHDDATEMYFLSAARAVSGLLQACGSVALPAVSCSALVSAVFTKGRVAAPSVLTDFTLSLMGGYSGFAKDVLPAFLHLCCFYWNNREEVTPPLPADIPLTSSRGLRRRPAPKPQSQSTDPRPLNSSVQPLTSTMSLLLTTLARVVSTKAPLPREGGAGWEAYTLYTLNLKSPSLRKISSPLCSYLEGMITEAVTDEDNGGKTKLRGKGHPSCVTSHPHLLWSALTVLPHLEPKPACAELSALFTRLSSVLVNTSPSASSYDTDSCLLSASMFALALLHKSSLKDLVSWNDVFHLLRARPDNGHVLRSVDLYLTLCKPTCVIDGADAARSCLEAVEDQLGSPLSLVRLLSLQVLSHFNPDQALAQGKPVFASCLNAERIKCSVHTFRDREMHLKRLAYTSVGQTVVETGLSAAVIKYLVGQLYVNYTPLWAPVTELIATYAAEMKRDVFWAGFSPALHVCDDRLSQRITIRKDSTEEMTPDTDGSDDEDGSDDDILSSQIVRLSSKDRTDVNNFRQLLWKAMARFSRVAETKSKELVPLFFTFLNNEYYMSNPFIAPTENVLKDSTAHETDESSDDTDDDETEVNPEAAAAQEKKEANKSRVQKKGVKRERQQATRRSKAIAQTFLTMLDLFGIFTSPVTVHKSDRLRLLYHELTTSRDARIQSAALRCLLSYKPAYLLPYAQSLQALLIDEDFRNLTTSFSLSAEDESSAADAESSNIGQSLIGNEDENRNRNKKRGKDGENISKTKNAARSAVTCVKRQHRAGLLPVLMRLLLGRLQAKAGKDKSSRAQSQGRRAAIGRFLLGCTEEELAMLVNLMVTPFKHLSPELSEPQSLPELTDVVPLERHLGLLSTLELLIRFLGRCLGAAGCGRLLAVTVNVCGFVTMLSRKRDHLTTRTLSLIKLVRQTGFTLLKTFFETYDTYEFKAQEVDAIFERVVWPAIPSLPAESAVAPSGLLRLILSWCSAPRCHRLLGRSPPLLSSGDDGKDKDMECDVESPHATSIISQLVTLLTRSNTSAKVKSIVLSALHKLTEPMVPVDVTGVATEGGRNQLDQRSESSLPEPKNVAEIPSPMEIDSTAGELSLGICLLLPYLSPLMEHIERSVEDTWIGRKKKGGGRRLPKEELEILSRICGYVKEEKATQKVMGLLVSLLTKPDALRPREQMTLIPIVSDLFSRSNVDEHMIASMLMLYSVRETRARSLLLELFSSLGNSHSTYSRVAHFIVEANAMSRTYVGEPDVRTRLEAFQKYPELEKSQPFEVLALINICCYSIEEVDQLALRNTCSEKLSDIIAHVKKSSDDALYKLYIGELQRPLRTGIKSTALVVRGKYLSLLGQLVKNFPDRTPFDDLTPFCGDSAESDVFTSLCDLQVPRRAQGLRRLAKILMQPALTLESAAADPSSRRSVAGSVGLEHKITQKTLKDILLPIAEATVKVNTGIVPTGESGGGARKGGKDDDGDRPAAPQISTSAALVEAYVETVGGVSVRLDWNNYYHQLHTYIGKMLGEGEQSKLGLRLVIACLDGFHFDISASDSVFNKKPPPKSTKRKGKRAPTTESSTNIGDTDLGNHPAPSSGGHALVVHALSQVAGAVLCPLAQAVKIRKMVEEGIIPRLYDSLTRKARSEGEHKTVRTGDVEESEVIRIPVAVAIVKLLQRCSADLLHKNLHKLLLRVCMTLKSRAENLREVSRRTLARILAALGPSYLSHIIRDMKTTLTRGYQLHVLSYSTCHLLKSVTVKGPIGADTTGKVVAPGDIDHMVHSLIEIFNEELFGKVSKEKEVDEIVGKLKEAKAKTAYQSYDILASLISPSMVSTVINPLVVVLETARKDKNIAKVTEVFRNITAGLLRNSALSGPVIIKLVHALMSNSLACLKKDYKADDRRRKRDAAGILKAKAASKDEEEEDWEIDNFHDSLNESDTRLPTRRPQSCLIIPAEPKRTAPKPPPVNSQACHRVIVGFALGLLDSFLKRNRPFRSPTEAWAMLDPLMKPLVNSLNSNHPTVMTAALRCILRLLRPCTRGQEVGTDQDTLTGEEGKDGEAIKADTNKGSALQKKKKGGGPTCWAPPSLVKQAPLTVRTIFDSLRLFTQGGAPLSEETSLLVGTCFKTLTAILREPTFLAAVEATSSDTRQQTADSKGNNSKGNTRRKRKNGDDQKVSPVGLFTPILSYVEEQADHEAFSEWAHASAVFDLLRAIISSGRRLGVNQEQLTDVIKRMRVMSVVEPRDRPRQMAREIVLQYVRDYPPKPKSLLKKSILSGNIETFLPHTAELLRRETYINPVAEFYMVNLVFEEGFGRSSCAEVLGSLGRFMSKEELGLVAPGVLALLADRWVGETSTHIQGVMEGALTYLLQQVDATIRGDFIDHVSQLVSFTDPIRRYIYLKTIRLVMGVETTMFRSRLPSFLSSLHTFICDAPLPSTRLRRVANEEEDEGEGETGPVTDFQDGSWDKQGRVVSEAARLLAAVTSIFGFGGSSAVVQQMNDSWNRLHSLVRFPRAEPRANIARSYVAFLSQWTPDELLNDWKKSIGADNERGVLNGGSGTEVAVPAVNGKHGKAKHGKTKGKGGAGSIGEGGDAPVSAVRQQSLCYLTESDMPQKLRDLSADFCTQLKTSPLTEEHLEMIRRILFVLAKLIHGVTTCDIYMTANSGRKDEEGVVVVTVGWLLGRLVRVMKRESSRSASSRILTRTILELIKDLCSLREGLVGYDFVQHLPDLLPPIHRELNTSDSSEDQSPNKGIAQACLDSLERVCCAEGLKSDKVNADKPAGTGNSNRKKAAFLKAYFDAQQAVKTRANERKRAVAVEAVTNPEESARKKMKKNEKKTSDKKKRMFSERSAKNTSG